MCIILYQAEAGCVHYQLYRETGKENRFAMIETWASQADLTAHSKSDHVRSFQANQKENVTAVIQTFSPVEALI